MGLAFGWLLTIAGLLFWVNLAPVDMQREALLDMHKFMLLATELVIGPVVACDGLLIYVVSELIASWLLCMASQAGVES
jgi:hypothetical protein